MKKAVLLLVALLSVLALMFISCSNDVSFDDEGALFVSVSGGQARGLLPSVSMEIEKYDLTVTDSSEKVVASATLEKTSSGTSLRLPAGTYVVLVEAKNAAGDVIGNGTADATVKAGAANAVTVIVRECPGEGTFAVTVNANAGYGLKLKIYDLSGDKIYSKALMYEDGRFVTDGTVSLANGFYRFQLVRTDTDAVIKGSTLRIMKGVETSYEATFSFLSDGSLAIVNEIISIPSIEISLAKDTLNQSETLEASAAISGIENYTTCWFIDGNALGSFGPYSDLSQDISSLNPGTHELELYVKNSQIMWSESEVFTVEEAEVIMLLVPSFDESAGDGGRGLTDMFNDDTYFACFDTSTDPYAAYKNLYLSYGVMTTTPITPSLRTVSNVRLTKSAVNSLKTTLSFNSYGFNVEVDDIGIDFLEHEILIKYNIVENNAVVGTVDYVYNWREKTFSFRECVMLTLFGPTVPEEAYTFGAMVLEMHDIKLDTDIFGVPTGGYSTGSFKNGVLEKNAWVDFMNFQGTGSNGEEFYHPFKLMRNYLTISSRGGRLYSMSQPNAGTSRLYKIEDMDPESPVYTAMVGSGLVTIWSQEDLKNYDWGNFNGSDFVNYDNVSPSSFGMEFLQDLADLIYSNSSILRDSGLSDLSEPLILEDETQYGDRFFDSEEQMFTAYDVRTKTGAALQLSGTKWLFTIFSKSDYEYCNFDSFDSSIYRSYSDGDSHRKIADGLIEDHLKLCGITDENYIANYKQAHRYAELYGKGNSITDVTCEDPEVFKARLDEETKDKKEQCLIVEFKNMVFIHDGWSVTAGNGTVSLGSSSSYGPFVSCQESIRFDLTDGKLSNLECTTDTGLDAYDQILFISFPDAITSIADGALDALSSLEGVDVCKGFDTSNLPDGIVINVR